MLLLNFVIATITSGRLATGTGSLLHAQVHLPAGPLRLVLGQVVPLDVGLAVHHNVLRLGGVKQLERRVLAERLQVSLVVTHLVQVVHWSHLEDLHVSGVLETSMRAARVHKLTVSLLVAFEVVF